MKNFNWKDLLGQHSLFESLDPKEVERIIRQLLDDKVSDEREYSEGVAVVREGEPGASVFLVGRGVVQVILEGDNGEGTPISTLRQGEFFGEMALLEKKSRAATVKAKESCVLLEIKGQEFLKLLDEHKDVESKMLLKLSERLRHANDQILAVRVRGVDDKIESLKTKLEAEVKAVDAQLQYALRMSDQTNSKASEIISSAEHGRTQRTWFFGIVGMAVTTAGAFGLWKVLEVKDYVNQAKEAKQEIERIKADMVKMAPEFERYRGIGDSLETIIRATYQPDFRNALLSGTVDDINNSYSRLQQIHTNTRWFLDDVEIAIREKPERNYTNILENILSDAQNPRDRIRAHYLLLASAILGDKTKLFTKQLEDFRTYVKKQGRFKSEYKLDALTAVFDKQKPERQRRYQQVVRLIPTG